MGETDFSSYSRSELLSPTGRNRLLIADNSRRLMCCFSAHSGSRPMEKILMLRAFQALRLPEVSNIDRGLNDALPTLISAFVYHSIP